MTLNIRGICCLNTTDLFDFDSVLCNGGWNCNRSSKSMQRKGLAIPEELAVVGYNNSILAISSDPELTVGGQ